MARKIEVQLVGDSRSLERAFGRAHSSGSKLGKFAKTGLTAALAGVGAAAVGMGALLKVGFDEIKEGQKVSAQTAAVLKSTGGAANVTKGQVEKLAATMQDYTAIEDEVIQSGENMLLTFTNIRNRMGKNNDIFTQATKVAADLSVAMGMDMPKAALQIGKALNDPIRGMSRLQRIGVTFTEGQKKQVEAMMKAGDVAGAQKVILAELNKEFGGSAKAAGNTLPGQLAKLQIKFEALAEKIAVKFLPVLNDIMEWVNQHWPQISKVVETGAKIIGDAFIGISTAVGFVVDFFRTHWGTIGPILERVGERAREAMARLIDYWNGTLKPAIENIIEFAKALWKRFGDDIRRNLLNAISIVRNLLNIIKGIVEVVLAVIRDWSAAWNALKSIARNALSAVVTILRNFKDNFFAAAKAIGTAVKNGVVAGISALASALVSVIRGAVNSVIGVIRNFRIGFPGIDPPGPGSIPGFSVRPFSGIPNVHTGGDIARGGLANLQRGERVISARVTNRGGGSPGPYMILGTQQLVDFLRSTDQNYRRTNGGRGIFAT